MHTDPITAFKLLETLLIARTEAQAEGHTLTPAEVRTLWEQGHGAAADVPSICAAPDPASRLTACLLAEGLVSPGELAHLHQRLHQRLHATAAC